MYHMYTVGSLKVIAFLHPLQAVNGSIWFELHTVCMNYTMITVQWLSIDLNSPGAYRTRPRFSLPPKYPRTTSSDDIELQALILAKACACNRSCLPSTFD